MAAADSCPKGMHQLGYDHSYTGSLKTLVGSSASGDAERLYKAMEGLGTNEKEIIEVLGRRTFKERQEIKSAFQASYGKSLFERIDAETSGDFRTLLHMLLKDPAYLQAKGLFHSVQGLGTSERLINEILLSSSNAELAKIEQEYKMVLAEEKCAENRSLLGDLVGDTHGDYQKGLKLLMCKVRDEVTADELREGLKNGGKTIVNKEQAKMDCVAIHAASSKRMGTDEDAMMKIVLQRNEMQLVAIAAGYPEVAHRDIFDCLQSELTCDFRGLLLDAFEMACERGKYYGRLFRYCVRGLGTRDHLLMRLAITRSEIDMVDIKAAYEKEYGHSLAEDIKGDTSGDYCRLLLTLIGEQA